MIPNQNITEPTELLQTENQEFYIQARFITGLIFYPIVCFVGLIGNVLSIIVMSQKQMTSSTNVYLLALSISDSIKIVSDFMYFLSILLLHVNPSTGNKLYGFLYPYAHYILNSSLCVSAWLTMSVALERYIYVCHPTRVKTYCSMGRARTIATSVFVIMSLIAIPYAMRYRTVEVTNNVTQKVSYELSVTALWQNQLFSTIFTWTQYFIRSVIPLVSLILLNTMIMFGIRRCRLGRTKHRITMMLIFVIIVFLICTIPDAVMSTVLGMGYYEENFLARGIREITDLLLLINSALNFIIYCIFNTIFWRNFQSLFCPCCSRPGQLIEDSQMRRLSLIGQGSIRLKSRSVKCGAEKLIEQ